MEDESFEIDLSPITSSMEVQYPKSEIEQISDVFSNSVKEKTLKYKNAARDDIKNQEKQLFSQGNLFKKDFKENDLKLFYTFEIDKGLALSKTNNEKQEFQYLTSLCLLILFLIFSIVLSRKFRGKKKSDE